MSLSNFEFKEGMELRLEDKAAPSFVAAIFLEFSSNFILFAFEFDFCRFFVEEFIKLLSRPVPP